MTQTREELLPMLHSAAEELGSGLADELALLPRIERRRQWKNRHQSLEQAIDQIAARLGLTEADATVAIRLAADAFTARVKAISTTTGGHA